MKSIVITDEAHNELKKFGKMGDKFEDVLWKLMECCKEKGEQR